MLHSACRLGLSCAPGQSWTTPVDGPDGLGTGEFITQVNSGGIFHQLILRASEVSLDFKKGTNSSLESSPSARRRNPHS